MTNARRKLAAVAWLALALAALVNAGCLVAAVGAAAGGAAAAGYTYYNGLLFRDYSANLADTRAAVRASLLELQFPVAEEKVDTASTYIRTHTADGHGVRIYLDVVSSPIPAEGALTRVGIRVGFTGDDSVSARILDQVSRHLVARPGLAPPVVSTTPEPPISPTILPPRPLPVAEPASSRLVPIAAGSPSP